MTADFEPAIEGPAPAFTPPGSDILLGEDGNAFSVMGIAARVLRRAGAPTDYITTWRTHVTTAGDYDHLLGHTMQALDGEWITSHDHEREER